MSSEEVVIVHEDITLKQFCNVYPSSVEHAIHNVLRDYEYLKSANDEFLKNIKYYNTDCIKSLIEKLKKAQELNNELIPLLKSIVS